MSHYTTGMVQSYAPETYTAIVLPAFGCRGSISGCSLLKQELFPGQTVNIVQVDEEYGFFVSSNVIDAIYGTSETGRTVLAHESPAKAMLAWIAHMTSRMQPMYLLALVIDVVGGTVLAKYINGERVGITERLPAVGININEIVADEVMLVNVLEGTRYIVGWWRVEEGLIQIFVVAGDGVELIAEPEQWVKIGEEPDLRAKCTGYPVLFRYSFTGPGISESPPAISYNIGDPNPRALGGDAGANATKPGVYALTNLSSVKCRAALVGMHIYSEGGEILFRHSETLQPDQQITGTMPAVSKDALEWVVVFEIAPDTPKMKYTRAGQVLLDTDQPVKIGDRPDLFALSSAESNTTPDEHRTYYIDCYTEETPLELDDVFDDLPEELQP